MSNYISITFDTEGIKNNYPEASQDQDSPTMIDASFCYLVASTISSTGSGSDKLKLNLPLGAMIRFYARSASNNFDDAVLLYDISKSEGRRVFENFNPLTFQTDSLNSSRENPLGTSITHNTRYFFIESQVLEYGMEVENISFSLYTRNDSGDPELFGYFQFTATIYVKQP